MKLKGSLTVEASLIIPIFIISIYFYLFFLYIAVNDELVDISIMNSLQKNLSEHSIFIHNKRNLKKYTNIKIDEKYSKKFEDFKKNIKDIDDILVKLKIQSDLKKIQKSQLNINKKNIIYKNGMIKVSLEYDYISYISIFNYKIKEKKEFIYKSFIGIDKKNGIKHNLSKKDLVYITPFGTVYHSDRNCKYLKFKIKAINKKEINFYRNQSGGKYKVCNFCKNNNSDVVYITNFGGKYHSDINCHAIKRKPLEINKELVGDLEKCSKCGQNH